MSAGQYGNGLYGSGLFGGHAVENPPLVPTQIWVYTRTGTFKGMYQTGVSGIVSISFSHGEFGCMDFAIEFSSQVSINKSDVVKIKLFDFISCMFTGVVRTVPKDGSTDDQYLYSGYGLSEYFKRLNSGEYVQTTKTLAYIVDDIFDTLIGPNVVSISKASDYINLPAITLTSFKGHYVQVDDMLDAILKIANSTGDEYMYGVDSQGVFFFRPRSSEVIATVSTGRTGKYGIPEYSPVDASEERSSIIVLKKDGTYLTTLDGAGDPDIYQEKVTGPDISDADLLLWATGIMKDKERTLRSASISWEMFPDSPVVFGDGYMRVLSTVPPSEQLTSADTAWGDGAWGDGVWSGSAPAWTAADDTLAIKRVSYKLDSGEASRSIDLGALPVRLEMAIAAIEKKQIDLTVSLGR